MATLTHAPAKAAKPRRRRHAGRSPLAAPLAVFGAVTLIAAAYVAYVLWPRWPDAPITLSAPFLPISVAGVTFSIEPAAIRMPVQRRPGTQERVDLAYLWPSLTPPDPALRPTLGAPVDPNERLFLTIASGDATLPLIERVQTIYPRYLVAGADRGSRRVDAARLPRRHALSGRGTGVRAGCAGAFPRALLAARRGQ